MRFVVSSRRWAPAVLLGAWCVGASAQGSVAVNVPAAPLLPQSFGDWKQTGAPNASVPATVSLSSVSKDALEEAVPSRSAVQDYSRDAGGKSTAIHVEAIQFADRTGALSAYTLVRRADMREGKALGDLDSVGDSAVLFYAGSTLVLANGATAADVPSLQPLLTTLPKPSGSKNVLPLLPSYLPAAGLVQGSMRYALGPATYAAQGGVLPANSIGWEKSAEAITAAYEDKRGKETLTILGYPTPEIAGAHLRSAQEMLAGMGPGNQAAQSAKLRRERELVMIATGTFSPEAAQKLIDNIHMHQMLSFDKDVQPVFHTEVQKTASLLTNILVLFGILGGAAVLLGFFFGYGRAALRVLRGKPAATEAEFLSLHLDPQTKPAQFGPGAS